MAFTNWALELDKAIYARLIGDATLMAAVSSVWQEEAGTDVDQQPPASPYLVYSMVTSFEDGDSTAVAHNVTVDFKTYDDSSNPDRAQQADAEVERLFHDKPLTVTGFTNAGIRQTSKRRFRDDAGYWNVISTYLIRLTRPR